jgi:hypothetical protein
MKKKKFAMTLALLPLTVIGLAGCSPGFQSIEAELDLPSSFSFDPNQKMMIGDMVIEPGDLRPDPIRSRNNKHLNQFASGLQTYKYNAVPWPNGILPVRFADDISPEQVNAFMKACSIWEQTNLVRCVRHTNETGYLYLTLKADWPGCWANVGAGFMPGQRRMNLDPNCWHEEVILHEIGHVLGLMHEHQRPDRDKYIEIKLDQVQPFYHFAFDIIPTSFSSPEYDFHSIMHYHPFGASENGAQVIFARPGYEAFDQTMGKAKLPSNGDHQFIIATYGYEAISNLSRDILERELESEELELYFEIRQRSGLAAVRLAMANSDESRERITKLIFMNLTGREPSADELADQLELLQVYSFSFLRDQFLYSDTVRERIKNLYQEFLGRQPTFSEEWTHLSQLGQIGFAEIRQQIANSKEAQIRNKVQEYVTGYYLHLLARTPDHEGLNSWSMQLSSGAMTCAQTAKTLALSNEFNSRNLSNESWLDAIYKSFLGRAPDAEGFAGWKAALDRASSEFSSIFALRA